MFKKIFLIPIFLCCLCLTLQAQTDKGDSLKKNQGNVIDNKRLESLLVEQQRQRELDSLSRENLLKQIEQSQNKSANTRIALDKKLQEMNSRDSLRKQRLLMKVDSIKKHAEHYPVAPFQDSLFFIYTKLGSSMAKDRAANVTRRIKLLYNDDFLKLDSINIQEAEYTSDIIYKELIITSISELDALLEGSTKDALAKKYVEIIKKSIKKERADNSFTKMLTRIALVILIGLLFIMLAKLIGRLHRYMVDKLMRERNTRIQDLKLKNYVLLTAIQKTRIILQLLSAFKWLLIIVLVFIMLPIMFSIFPFTQSWASNLIDLFTAPLKKAAAAIWNYIPNLITIIVIVVAFWYITKFIKYIFTEISKGKLEISGFHADFAMPTYTIVRFLLQAFLLILIFPYLPGSDSNVFKGVSVFIGVLFSLGSSSAISNIIAGMVITFMRSFKIGDRITVATITGVVIEKSPLVTRLRTVRNEEVTIPNSAVLSGNTINYSTFSEDGVSIPVEITVGYDIPWEKVHQVLLTAASKIELVRKEPKPFVLQKKLDDYYVIYELNVFITLSKDTDLVRSSLLEMLQDDLRGAGIDLNSPAIYAKMDLPPHYWPGLPKSE